MVSAQADAVTYSDGDLFLGVRASGNAGATQTYLINIGQGSVFRDKALGSTFTLGLGNIAIDLAAIYGSNWATRADLFWGVAGSTSILNAGDPANTIYASKEEVQAGAPGTGWDRRSNSQQTATVSKMQGVASGYTTDQQGSTDTNSSFAVIENITDPNNWASFQPGGVNSTAGSSFGVFTPSVEGDAPGGITSTKLDLFRMVRSGLDDGTGLTSGTGSYEGTFSIGSNGAVSYSVVPEPSTAALVCAGFTALGLARRRRASAKLDFAA